MEAKLEGAVLAAEFGPGSLLVDGSGIDVGSVVRFGVDFAVTLVVSVAVEFSALPGPRLGLGGICFRGSGGLWPSVV